MANKKIDQFFEDEIEEVDDFFDKNEKISKEIRRCKTCGAEIETDSQYCPMCGSKVEGSEAIVEKAAPKVIKPRPLAKGEKVTASATPTKEYKYGDGYSVSSISLWALYGSWLYPIVALVISLIGLKSKNPKDVKLFKIAIVLSIVFLIVHIVIIALYATGSIQLN